MSNPIEVKSTLKPAYDHVIVGGGVAADKAARAIREEAPEASVLIISDVGDGPLYRPGLSKDLWLKAGTTLEDIDLGTTQTGAELLLGTTVTALDPASHTVTTSDDQQIRYGRLLLATGASARRIDTPDDDRIVYYRNADDYRHLRSLVSEAPGSPSWAGVTSPPRSPPDSRRWEPMSASISRTTGCWSRCSRTRSPAT